MMKQEAAAERCGKREEEADEEGKPDPYDAGRVL